jgi:hypothetical protein
LAERKVCLQTFLFGVLQCKTPPLINAGNRRVRPADQGEEKGPWMAPAGLNPGPERTNRKFVSGGRFPALADVIPCNIRNYSFIGLTPPPKKAPNFSSLFPPVYQRCTKELKMRLFYSWRGFHTPQLCCGYQV